MCRTFKVIIAGHGRLAMPPSLSFLRCRRAAIDAVARPDALRILLIAALHAAALALLAWSEVGTVSKAVFLLVWGLFNFFWLALLRRPAVSAALSLAMIVALILLSRFKYDIIWMTLSFLDLWIVDADTVAFLLTMFPDLASLACHRARRGASGAGPALVARSASGCGADRVSASSPASPA